MNNTEIILLFAAIAIMAAILICGQTTGKIYPFGQKLKKSNHSSFTSSSWPPLPKGMEKRILAKYAELKADAEKQEEDEIKQLELIRNCPNEFLAAMIRNEKVVDIRIYQAIHNEALARILLKI